MEVRVNELINKISNAAHDQMMSAGTGDVSFLLGYRDGLKQIGCYPCFASEKRYYLAGYYEGRYLKKRLTEKT